MINAIAAIGKNNRVLGNKGQIPWHIPEDFAYFKKTALGHPIIMGRKTFESLPSLLKDRVHIVITRDKDYRAPEEVLISDSIENAIEIAKKQPGSNEIFIIGGGQIYESAMQLIDRLCLTTIDGDFEGDTFFPEYSEFSKVIKEEKYSNDKYNFTFLVLEK